MAMLATEHDSMAYEDNTERKANRHKDEDRSPSHIVLLMKTTE